MAPYYAVAALLWLLLAVLSFSLVTIVFFPGRELTAMERVASAAVVLLLATPAAMQLFSLHSRMREMRANFLVVDESGVRVRLAGVHRGSKVLPEIQETLVRWSEVTSVSRERRKFTYRSRIPFSYPLDVYTMVTAGAAIPFTKECIPGAKRAAREIAARIGQEVRRAAG